MMINFKPHEIYYTARNFLAKDCKYSELKEVFEEHLEEYFKDEKFKFADTNMSLDDLKKCEELSDTITEHLLSFGWTDEEMIEAVLSKRKEKYHMEYVDENHAQADYFKVMELEDD